MSGAESGQHSSETSQSDGLTIDEAVKALAVERRTLVRALTNALLYAPENSLVVAGATRADTSVGRRRRLFVGRRDAVGARPVWTITLDPPQSEWQALRRLRVEESGPRSKGSTYASQGLTAAAAGGGISPRGVGISDHLTPRLGWWSRRSGYAQLMIIVLVFSGLSFMALFIAEALGLTYDQRHPESGSESQPSSAAYKLAAIDSDSRTPPNAQVATMAAVLRRLTTKCPHDTEGRLGDFLVTAQSALARRGKVMSIVMLANYVDGSIPASGYSGSCSDVVSAFVTLTTAP